MIVIYRSAVSGRRLQFYSREILRVDPTSEGGIEVKTTTGARYQVTSLAPERRIHDGENDHA